MKKITPILIGFSLLMFWCSPTYSNTSENSIYKTEEVSKKKNKKGYKSPKARKYKRKGTKSFDAQNKKLKRQRNMTVKSPKYAGKYNKFWVD